MKSAVRCTLAEGWERVSCSSNAEESSGQNMERCKAPVVAPGVEDNTERTEDLGNPLW